MATTEEEIIIDVTAKGATKAESQLEGVADATNKANDEGEKYEQTLGDMAKETEVFGVSLNGLSKGFKSALTSTKASVKGLKAFRVALIGTGVGLLVVALGSLVAYLTRTQKGMNLVSDAMAVVSGVINTVLGVAIKLGRALVAMATGNIREGIKGLATAFDGVGKAMKTNIALSLELERLNQNMGVQAATNNLLISENNILLAEQKRRSDDITLSFAQRIAAAKESQRLIDKNAKLTIANIKEETRANTLKAQEEVRWGGILDETLIRTAELLTEQNAAQASADETKIESANKLNGLYKEQQAAISELSGVQSKAFKTEETDIIKLGKIKTKDFNKEKEQNETLRKQRQEMAISNQTAAIQTSDVVLAEIEKQYGESKLLSIAKAGIDLWAAIAAANTLVPPANIPAIAFASATGLNAIAKIKQFEEGGMINGPSHAGGGVMINAEGGEGIINKRSMAIPWVKAQASRLNTLGGGVPFMRDGGLVPAPPANPFIDLASAVQTTRSVLVVEDLTTVQERILVSDALSTL